MSKIQLRDNKPIDEDKLTTDEIIKLVKDSIIDMEFSIIELKSYLEVLKVRKMAEDLLETHKPSH